MLTLLFKIETMSEENNYGIFDPTSELDQEIIDKCQKEANDLIDKTYSRDLDLAKSEITVPGQEYAVVSFVGESLNQKTDKFGMKIWGCFPDVESAKSRAHQINNDEDNKIYDVYVMEMYCWTIIPPDRNCIDDNNYHEQKLDEMIKEHKKQEQMKTNVFNARKTALTNNPDINTLERNKELESIAEESVIHDPIFGEIRKLPKFEVTDANNRVTSFAQGLTETDEEYEERKKQFQNESK